MRNRELFDALFVFAIIATVLILIVLFAPSARASHAFPDLDHRLPLTLSEKLIRYYESPWWIH